MSFALCHPANPRRAVDWRWIAATGIRDGSLPPASCWLDAWVERAIAFLDERDGHDVVLHIHRPVRPDRDLAAACAIRADADRLVRWQLEALLLAGEGDASIAGRCGIEPGVVEAYAQVFFHVRPRLALPSCILHSAIGVYQELFEPDPGLVWRWLGYAGGPLVVDFLVDAAREAGGVEALGAIGPGAATVRKARLVRLTSAALTVCLDGAEMERLAPLIAAFDEIEEPGSSASIRPIDAGFASMVAGLELTPDDAGSVDEIPIGRAGSRAGRADSGRLAQGAGGERVAELRRVGS